MTWAYGDVIVHREIAWGRPWLAIPERVVDDTDALLVTCIQSGAPFGYGAGPWPTETGRHPWHPNQAWQGHRHPDRATTGRCVLGAALLNR